MRSFIDFVEEVLQVERLNWVKIVREMSRKSIVLSRVDLELNVSWRFLGEICGLS
jgi:hypothetical protein